MLDELFGGLFGTMLGGVPKNPIGTEVEHDGINFKLLMEVPGFHGAYFAIPESEPGSGQYRFGSQVYMIEHTPTRTRSEDKEESRIRWGMLTDIGRGFGDNSWGKILSSPDCHEDCGVRGLPDLERDENGLWPPLLDCLCPGHRALAETWMGWWQYQERRKPGDLLWKRPELPTYTSEEQFRRWRRQIELMRVVQETMGIVELPTQRRYQWGILMDEAECKQQEQCPARWRNPTLFAGAWPHLAHVVDDDEFLSRLCPVHRVPVDEYLADHGWPEVPKEE
jgi:hypothetical protein